MGGIPIVSLDKIYLTIDNEYTYFLDCTRLDGSSELVSRNNPLDPFYVDNEIKKLSKIFLDYGVKEIVLADDVVYSGKVLSTIIEKFRCNNIYVVGIRSCVSTFLSYKYFNYNLPLGLKCGCILGNNVVDQICERDFYFGIVQSGISIKDNNDIVYKSPYFKPYGNPVERASIPSDMEFKFSKGCLKRSYLLWDEINTLSNNEFLIGDLPEKIINTNETDSIARVLKKGIK